MYGHSDARQPWIRPEQMPRPSTPKKSKMREDARLMLPVAPASRVFNSYHSIRDAQPQIYGTSHPVRSMSHSLSKLLEGLDALL